jgi:SNF2 family DNA or RNA helicase
MTEGKRSRPRNSERGSGIKENLGVTVLVNESLRFRVPFQVPQPLLGELLEIADYQDGDFELPSTLNPERAKSVFAKAGIQLSFTKEALRRIADVRQVRLEYDPAGRVWIRTVEGVSLRDLLDDYLLKTYAVWNNFHEAWRLRQAGAINHAKAAFEAEGILVLLEGFTRPQQPALRTLDPPRSLKVRLYPFQKRAVSYIVKRDGRAGLFDEMGLGKTISSTQAALKLIREAKAKRILIVAPAALLDQWGNELRDKFGLEPTIVSSKSSLGERARLYDNPLAVMNYELLRVDMELILEKQFDTLILDEATRVKNWDTQTSEAVKTLIVRNLIALTGTPLENHLRELYNIVNIIHPGFFGRYKEDFLAEYATFDPQGRPDVPILTPQGAQALREKMRQISIRRTKNEVLAELPSLATQYVYMEPTPNQRRVYDLLQLDLKRAIAAEAKYAAREFEGPNPFTANRIRLYNLLRETCADISMIVSYLERKEQEDSPDATELRASQFFQQLRRYVARLEPENAKLAELRELVADLVEEGHKIVIFSQYVPVVRLIQSALAEKSFGTLLFHGGLSSDERVENLRRFSEEAEPRILASTDAGQFGLNLQVADVIINYDLPWNPARLQQRIARLHRIGQPNKVLAINFVVKGTIEEYVREVLESKKELFRQVTGTGFLEEEELPLDALRRMFRVDFTKNAIGVKTAS